RQAKRKSACASSSPITSSASPARRPCRSSGRTARCQSLATPSHEAARHGDHRRTGYAPGASSRPPRLAAGDPAAGRTAHPAFDAYRPRLPHLRLAATARTAARRLSGALCARRQRPVSLAGDPGPGAGSPSRPHAAQQRTGGRRGLSGRSTVRLQGSRRGLHARRRGPPAPARPRAATLWRCRALPGLSRKRTQADDRERRPGRAPPAYVGAVRYLGFLECDLRPMFAARRPVDPQRQTLFGHSYGGLFSLYTLLNRPQAFSGYVAASPSIWWYQGYIERTLAAFEARARQQPLDARLLLTVGSAEEPAADAPLTVPRQRHMAERRMIGNARDLAERLESTPGLEVGLRINAGANHGTNGQLSSVQALELASSGLGSETKAEN